MAEVFRAKPLDVASAQIVAIKRIRPHLAADEQFVQMFVDEAHVAGQLRHQNIVQVHELGKLQGTHFIAMEYVFGRDLLQLLGCLKNANQVMAPQMAAWITAKMLAGLQYAHTKAAPDGRPLALVHRDISPQNVLISYDGAVKLIDFGIAKASSRAYQTMGNVVKGKVGYMSPQQILGEPIDHRSDVFAASTCLHEMLTCRRLFWAPTDAEVISRVRSANVPPPSTINPAVSSELDSIVLQGLALRPEERWQSAGEMQNALLGYLSRHPPGFASEELRLVMHAIFADEVDREWSHLNGLQQVVQPGINVQSPDRENTQPDAFPGSQTLIGTGSDGSETLSRVVPVESIIAVGETPQPAPSSPRPITEPPRHDPAPEEFMPGSTQAFPLLVTPGGVDDPETMDTGDDFSRPFLGSSRFAGQKMVAVPVPNGSIPDLPAMPRPSPKEPPSALPASVRPVLQKQQTPWLLLGMTAAIALVAGALGLLILLFVAGLLPT